MLEPDNQKVYFVSDDLSKLYPDAEDPQDKALDVLEGEQSFIMVDGKQLAIGYDSDKDAVIVEDSDVSGDVADKARRLMQLFVENKLFTSKEIEGENGFMPDEDYPMSVNVTDGQSYRVNAYYPSMEQMANTEVHIWSGSGYKTDVFYIHTDKGASDAEGALEEAVVWAEKINPDVLLDVDDVEKRAVDDNMLNPVTGDTTAEFDETYLYVDATMAGASKPYYIYAENLAVRSHKGVLA